MKDTLITIIIVALLIIAIIGGIFWTKYQWDMCREAGMSFWYCVKHIS